MTDQPTTDTSLSDQFATDSGSSPLTIVRPAGAPHLWPFMKLPRRERANFFRLMAKLPVDDEGNLGFDVEKGTVTGIGQLNSAAGMYDLLADVEDALRVCAQDKHAFNTWVLQAEDQALMQLMGWYFQRFQPGEATASPTS